MFKELTVEQWVDQVQLGLKFRSEHGLERNWAGLEAMFYNVHESMMNAGPNIIESTGDAFLSMLSVPYPYATVKARRPEFFLMSKLVETVANNLLDDCHVQDAMEDMIFYAYLWGTGFIKIGYDSEFGWDPEFDLGGTQQPMGLTPTQYDKRGNKIEFGPAKPGMPWVNACLPHDIVVPWGVKELRQSPWVVHRVIRHIEDCKADVKYSTKDLQPVMTMADFVKSYQKELAQYRIGKTEADMAQNLDPASGKAEFVELWEVHDRRTGRIMVLATGHDKFLRNEVDELQINGSLPFVSLSFVPRSRTLWTTSDSYYLKQCQSEIADITIQAAKHRRGRIIKLLYKEGAITEVELEKMQNPTVGAAVAISADSNINEAVQHVQAPPDYNFYQDQEQIRANARETVGFSRNQVGEFQGGRTTAQEVRTVQDASDLRTNRRSNHVADAYEEITRQLINTARKFWKYPRTAQVVGPNGTGQWLQFQGSDLVGDYTYKIAMSNNQNDTLDMRRQRALQAYELLSQDPLVDRVQLIRYLANEYNDPEFSSIFPPQVLQGLASAPMLPEATQAGGVPAPGGGQANPVQQPAPAQPQAMPRPGGQGVQPGRPNPGTHQRTRGGPSYVQNPR